MKTAKKLAFLLILGVALFGRTTTTWATCDVQIAGEGSCTDMSYAIEAVIGQWGDCLDYCDYVPNCNPSASYCWVRPQFTWCDSQEHDGWSCWCLCAY